VFDHWLNPSSAQKASVAVLPDQAALLGDYVSAAKWIEKAYEKRAYLFIAHIMRKTPEEWPDDPSIQAALDKPELNALYEDPPSIPRLFSIANRNRPYACVACSDQNLCSVELTDAGRRELNA
jgi:hypothetical protein